jgi:hypothetical protein
VPRQLTDAKDVEKGPTRHPKGQVWGRAERAAAGSWGAALATVPSRASRDADGAPAVFLRGYLQLLAEVSLTGRRPTAEELESRRMLGLQAAEQGLPLRALVDLYLSAAWISWSQLPGVRRANGIRELRSVGEAVFRAVDGSVVALAEGYEAAQRLAIRQEEALRREFVEDLLHGRGDMGLLAERAERFGLTLAGANVVAVAEAAVPFLPENPAGRHVEAALLARFHTQKVLVATKEGLLVCVAPSAPDDTLGEFVRQLEAVLGAEADWRVGLGRPRPGPAGVVRSFEEARSALQLAARLGIDRRVVKATDLLVFPVLLRDSAAITELVTTVLGPLQKARGGPQPLFETLAAYFACGGVATETARTIHIGVRTVRYRLERVRELTGYSADHALERYTLETAVLGARLLGWPEQVHRAAERS